MPEQHHTWLDSMAAAYERLLVPTVFVPFAADMAGRVTRIGAAPVLEVAAGTGVLTRLLPARGLIATDLNPPMVRLGRRKAPGAAWAAADGTRLPFRNDSFALILCQFGVMFFPDKPAAFAELARVSRADGRFLFTVWGPLEEHEFEFTLVRSMQRVLGPDAPDFFGRIPHGYADVTQIERDLAAGGMSAVSIETIELTGQAASTKQLVTGYCTGTPLRAQLGDPAEAPTVRERLTAEMVREFGTGPITGRMTARIIEARPQRS